MVTNSLLYTTKLKTNRCIETLSASASRNFSSLHVCSSANAFLQTRKSSAAMTDCQAKFRRPNSSREASGRPAYSRLIIDPDGLSAPHIKNSLDGHLFPPPAGDGTPDSLPSFGTRILLLFFWIGTYQTHGRSRPKPIWAWPSLRDAFIIQEIVLCNASETTNNRLKTCRV